jgi:hypothetical protein
VQPALPHGHTAARSCCDGSDRTASIPPPLPACLLTQTSFGVRLRGGGTCTYTMPNVCSAVLPNNIATAVAPAPPNFCKKSAPAPPPPGKAACMMQPPRDTRSNMPHTSSIVKGGLDVQSCPSTHANPQTDSSAPMGCCYTTRCCCCGTSPPPLPKNPAKCGPLPPSKPSQGHLHDAATNVTLCKTSPTVGKSRRAPCHHESPPPSPERARVHLPCATTSPVLLM